MEIAIMIVILMFLIIYQSFKIKEYKKQIRILKDEKANLEKEREKIEKTGELLKQVFAEISHDIRAPISNIICLSKIMKENISNKEKVIRYLNKIDNSAQYLLRLSNDILNIRKLETNNFNLKNEKIDLKDTLNRCFSIVENKMHEKRIKFSKNITKLKHTYVYGDELILHRIFTNILTNSINHTSKGGKISFQAKEISVLENKVEVQFKISDNGEGMNKEFLTHMWEAYKKDENSISQRDSTGLGLAITKKCVDLMDGSIDVESQVGQGSQFIIKVKFDIAIEEEIK